MKLTKVSQILSLTLLLYIQAEAFKIVNVDYLIRQFENHHTKQFYADNGLSKLIVRRGANFTFKIQMDETVTPDLEVRIQLLFDTRQDRMLLRLPPNENGWKLEYTKSGKDINVALHIPGNASVGVWYMYITVANDYDVIYYQVPHEIVVLFNAWSPEDPAYFPETYKLSEYVLSEVGHLYFYNWRRWYYNLWVFGQFQPNVLNAILFILDRTRLTAVDRGDIVKVTRTLTHMLNDGGPGHHGVLRGRWKEPYNDTLYGYSTTHPSHWAGSPEIFDLYYSRGGVPVGYGQCWVFAGILTTAYRALGIASRPLGNFASAHDDGNDLTADTYLDKNGNVDNARSDTLWNFHEWVEAFFKREDLNMTHGEWQELDATPQGINDGRLQVGPASISHIYNSTLGSKYETSYLYSEVNSDEVVWNYQNKVVNIRRNSVGLAVKTKAYGSEKTEDITNNYKPREGTIEERISYRRAAAAINKKPVSLRYETNARTLSDAISISFKETGEIYVGQSIPVEITLKNLKSKPQSLSLSVKASSVYYNGKLKDVIRNYNWTFTLKKLQTKRILFTIEENEYMTKLADQRTVIVDASAMNGDDIYQVIERFTLLSPQLEIELPSTVERNSEFNMSVSFKNPLNQTLKSCSLIVEGKGYRRKTFNVSDVNALGTSSTTLRLSTSGVNTETFIVTLYTAELKESVAFAHLDVNGKLDYRFQKYTLKNEESDTRRRKPAARTSKRSAHNVTVDMFECCETVVFS